MCGIFGSWTPVRGPWFGCEHLIIFMFVWVLFLVIDNVLLFVVDYCNFCLFVLLLHFGRLSLPDLSADAWQLHDGHVSGLMGPTRADLNSRLASTKVSSDSFTSALCGYLRSNHSFVKNVKQDRRRKFVSDATVEAARKEKNHLKKVALRRDSTPQDRRVFYEAIRSHCRLKRLYEQAQRERDAMFQERS
jgi:hypothetical protein